MKERNASFEVLRVLAMVMVITLHALGHGGLLAQYDIGHAGYYIGWLIRSLCYVAVNCFVLITGYFMVNSDMKLSRILKLIAQVWFYSVVCLLATKFVFKQPVGLKALICALFPLTGNQYWFATAYAVLLAVSPLLNKLIHAMNKKEHFLAIVLLSVVFSVIPTIFFWGRKPLGNGYDFVWFAVLYLVAAYIRLYGIHLSGKQSVLGFFATALTALLSNVAIALVTKLVFGVPKRVDLLFEYNSVLFLAAAVCLFTAFTKTEEKNTVANVIAGFGKYAFGAYLISDHVLIRAPLWNWINLPGVAEKGILAIFGYMLLIVITIVVAGCAVEWLRSVITEKLGLNKLFVKVDFLLEKSIDRIAQRIL